MSASRNTAAAPPGVSFEVDRFAWADGRLELSGRWYGIRGRRFLRPTLDVEVDGIPRRMLAVLEHKPWAADDGEPWTAAFKWDGGNLDAERAELEVGRDLVVDLPLPDKRRRRRRRSTSSFEPVDEALKAEVGLLRGQIERLRAELAGREREIIALRSQLDEETDAEGLPIAGVASNKRGVRALERAERAGIPTAVFDARDFESRDDRDRDLPARGGRRTGGA